MKKTRGLVLGFLVIAGMLASSIVPVLAAQQVTVLDPAWQVTNNGIVDSSVVLGSALPSSDVAWGGWSDDVWNEGTWRSWDHLGDNHAQTTDFWLRTTLEVPNNWGVQSVKMVYINDSSYFPINDDMYVFVDGVYVAGGGSISDETVLPLITALVGPTAPPDPAPYGTFVTAWWVPEIATETDWAITNGIDGGLALPASLLGPGSHTIEILCEEFAYSGGIGHPVFQFTYNDNANFLTGGATIKLAKKVEWNAAGNVGYRADGSIVGEFTIIKPDGSLYKCRNDFSSLVFSGPPTISPKASMNKAKFTGNFTDKNGAVHILTVTISDWQDTGKGSDKITIDEGDNHWLVLTDISTGNYQIHEGFK